ncbi:MAG: hypothetical protein OEM39_02810, partial [Acidimicrobiia bacterium]|nr:hypothetical protein [Acidimicrobiia bacterium]
LILVNLAEELPTTETKQTLAWLDENKFVPPPVIVTNRLVPDLEAEPSGSGPVYEAAVHHRAVRSEQQHWAQQLPPDITLPYLFGLLTPGEVSARIADEMDDYV